MGAHPGTRQDYMMTEGPAPSRMCVCAHLWSRTLIEPLPLTFSECKSRVIVHHPLPRITMVEINLLCLKGPLKMLSVIIIIAK